MVVRRRMQQVSHAEHRDAFTDIVMTTSPQPVADRYHFLSRSFCRSALNVSRIASSTRASVAAMLTTP